LFLSLSFFFLSLDEPKKLDEDVCEKDCTMPEVWPYGTGAGFRELEAWLAASSSSSSKGFSVSRMTLDFS
jgi:hypothetical protein